MSGATIYHYRFSPPLSIRPCAVYIVPDIVYIYVYIYCIYIFFLLLCGVLRIMLVVYFTKLYCSLNVCPQMLAAAQQQHSRSRSSSSQLSSRRAATKIIHIITINNTMIVFSQRRSRLSLCGHAVVCGYVNRRAKFMHFLFEKFYITYQVLRSILLNSIPGIYVCVLFQDSSPCR